MWATPDSSWRAHNWKRENFLKTRIQIEIIFWADALRSVLLQLWSILHSLLPSLLILCRVLCCVLFSWWGYLKVIDIINLTKKGGKGEIFFCFWDRVLLCISSCLWIHSPVSASWELELQKCTIVFCFSNTGITIFSSCIYICISLISLHFYLPLLLLS
jgi:hypothetical protein